MDREEVLYHPAEGNRPMFNNCDLSDVQFLVEGQIVYGHKFVLAKGSPVFKSMFFGELREQSDVIEIEDLTLAGFQNALRFIYGLPIDYELFELHESYLAADKYLMNHFDKAFFRYVQSMLDAKSSCLIYDQLVKIGEREEIRLADVRTVIIENSRVTIGSDHFPQIDQETLISLLSLDKLDIDEVDLLEAVSKWVDCEVQRQGLPLNRENRRKIFEPIKGYVLFTAFKPEKIANCKVIAELLTLEESGSLVLHLLNKDQPLMIEPKTSRSARARACSVFVKGSFSADGFLGSRAVYLTVHRPASIRAIYLNYSPKDINLAFQILKISTGKHLATKAKRTVRDGKLCLTLNRPLDLEATQQYELRVTYNETLTNEDSLTRGQTLTYRGSILFTLEPAYDYNFIRGLEFVPLDWPDLDF